MLERKKRTAVAIAQQAHACAHHYKNFHVSCVGYAKGRMLIGTNIKQREEDIPVCAEEAVMLQAEEHGLILEWMVIYGQPREQDETDTLHCCEERCLPAMRRRARQGKAVSFTTELICVNSIDGTEEKFTVETMHAEHGIPLDAP